MPLSTELPSPLKRVTQESAKTGRLAGLVKGQDTWENERLVLQSTCECALQPLSPILHVKLCRILPDILSLYTIFPSTNVIHIFSFRPSNLSFIFHHPEDFENPEKCWKNPFRVEVTIAIHSNQATETKKNQRKEWNGQEDRHLHDVLAPPKKKDIIWQKACWDFFCRPTLLSLRTRFALKFWKRNVGISQKSLKSLQKYAQKCWAWDMAGGPWSGNRRKMRSNRMPPSIPWQDQGVLSWALKKNCFDWAARQSGAHIEESINGGRLRVGEAVELLPLSSVFKIPDKQAAMTHCQSNMMQSFKSQIIQDQAAKTENVSNKAMSTVDTEQ